MEVITPFLLVIVRFVVVIGILTVAIVVSLLRPAPPEEVAGDPRDNAEGRFEDSQAARELELKEK